MTQFQSHQTTKETYPILPDGMQRSDVERLIRRCAPIIGMNDGQLIVLLSMIEETRPSDWIKPDIEPVCFARQTNIATSSGKDERTVRRIERQLEHKFGFLVKDVALNGQRCRYRDSSGAEFRQGLAFTPLIDKIPELLALAKQIENARANRTIVKQKLSAAKRVVKYQLAALNEANPNTDLVKELNKTFLSWPTRFYASVTLDALHKHLAEVLNLVDRLVTLTPLVTNCVNDQTRDISPEIAIQRKIMSCPPDIYDRPLQDTNQETYVSCNTKQQKITDPVQNNIEPPTTTAARSRCFEEERCKGDVGSNSKFLTTLTPNRLFDLCSESMQANIRLYQGDAPYPTELNFVFAALDQAYELGITKWAHDYASHQMGNLTTALCILIIDRNINHPITPIKSPGGVLRAMTARHANGALFIERSLIGLMRRTN